MKKLLFLSMVLLVSGNALDAASSSYRLTGDEVKRFEYPKISLGTNKSRTKSGKLWKKITDTYLSYWGEPLTSDLDDMTPLQPGGLLEDDSASKPVRIVLNTLFWGLNAHEERLRELRKNINNISKDLDDVEKDLGVVEDKLGIE